MLPEISSTIGAPRVLEVPWPLGFPLGAANDPDLQRRVIIQALELTGRHELPVADKFTN